MEATSLKLSDQSAPYSRAGMLTAWLPDYMWHNMIWGYGTQLSAWLRFLYIAIDDNDVLERYNVAMYTDRRV